MRKKRRGKKKESSEWRHGEMDEKKNDLIGKEIKCNIDAIIAKKKEKLTGYGSRLAFRASTTLYQLKEAKVQPLEIFDQLAELCQILKDYTSETKGKQQQLL